MALCRATGCAAMGIEASATVYFEDGTAFHYCAGCAQLLYQMRVASGVRVAKVAIESSAVVPKEPPRRRGIRLEEEKP